MGCFFACFGSSKDRRRKEQSIRRVQPRVQRCPSFKPVHVQLPALDPFPESQCKDEQVSAETATGPFPEAHCKNELVGQLSLSSRKKVTFDSNIKTYELVVETKNVVNEGNSEKSTQSQSSSQDSSLTSVGSFPPSHRYQNCRESDGEDEEEDNYSGSDSEDDLSDHDDEEMLSSGTKSSADQVISEVSDSPDSDSPMISTMMSRGLSEQEVGVRDRTVYVDNVLNPVENLSQWKVVKSLGKLSTKNPRKENLQNDVVSGSPDPPVDASLSSWLGSDSGSGTRYEDRPILGGLSEFSTTMTLSRSSSWWSHEDVPIIGSVGSYWSNDSGQAEDRCSGGSVSSFKGIPNTTSKYREDKKVNWHSSPFETRLERALQSCAAAKAL